MLRYRIEWFEKGNLEAVNHLLTLGWRPAREQPLRSVGDVVSDALVVLERDDDFPIFSGELLADGTPLETLHDVSLLRGLTGCEVREIVAAGVIRRYAADSLLFDTGQSDRRLYVVLEGQVAIQLLGLMIDDPIVLTAGPRDVFGESALFSPAAHTTRATTSTVVRTLELSGAAFDELFQAGRPAASKLALNGAGLLAERLRATDAWVREILQGDKTSETIRSWRRFRHSLSSRGERPSTGGFVHA